MEIGPPWQSTFPEVESQSNWGQKRPILPEDRDRRRSYGTATPWPLDETYYLSVYDPLATNWGVYLIDAFGNRELLCRGPSAPCLSPIPLRPRKRPPAIPVLTTQAKADQTPNIKPEATISVMNVYDSDTKWPGGTKITALRIIQIYPKTTPYTDKPAIGPSQSLARGIIGIVPVESDGSAYFKAPVGVPIYFQALDESGMAVQSMRSVTYVHPGENLACQGCHEPKHHQKAIRPPLALRRRPTKIAPEVDGAWPLTFPRLVQPVLDRKCVACHQKKKACPLDGTSSDKGHSRAYRSLLPFVNWCGGKQRTHYQPYALGGGSRSIPGQFGAKGSKLFKNILLDKDHDKLKLTAGERRRIALWIDGVDHDRLRISFADAAGVVDDSERDDYNIATL